MHVAIAALAVLADAAPTPAPTTPPASEVTPGPWGFAAVVFVGVIVAFLLWDMMRRIRRARYREQVNEELDAEQAAEQPEGRQDAPAARDDKHSSNTRPGGGGDRRG